MGEQHAEHLSQLKRGFNRLARDLDRAYALARLSPAQQLILQAVRDASWRYRREDPDRTPTRIRLNLSGLARISGFNRSGLSVQLKLLVRRRLLLGDPAEGIEPNKNYRHWLNSSGQRLLTDAQIHWCLRRDRKVRTVEPAQQAGAVNSTPPVESFQQAGAVNSTPLLSQLNTPVEPAQQSHIKDSRAGRTFKNLQDICSAEDNHQEGADGGAADGGGVVGSVESLMNWADALGPTQDLPPVVHAWARSYPLDWIEAALLCGLVTSPGKIAQYANGCLARWKSRGGPPHAEVADARAVARTGPAGESKAQRQRREFVESIEREKRKEVLKNGQT